MSTEREPLIRVVGTAAPLPAVNVDTDQIIPAAYLKVTDKSGLAGGLFANWRYHNGDTSRPNADFVLNRPEHRSASVLLAGDNFGCGSSREHAPWALLAAGFRAVISTRFADIFRNNALKNGLLVAELPERACAALLDVVDAAPTTEVTLDLERCEVTAAGLQPTSFSIDPLARHCMLSGIDQFGYLLERLPEIEAWEAGRAVPIDTTGAP